MSFRNASAVSTAVILSGFLPWGGGRAQEVQQEVFGKTADGQVIHRFTLSNGTGLEVQVMNWGATLLSIEVPDWEGRSENVTLSLATFAEYEAGHPLLGSTVGRYANRIDGGGFEIEGKRFDLETVNAKTGVHIHGGRQGFAKQLWSGKVIEEDDSVGVEFSHESPDGHEGFPGRVEVTVTYRLNPENELEIEYLGTTSRPTHLNLTNHAYFNLAGAGSGSVLDHRLTLEAEGILAIDDRKIPTGEILPVAGTAFDFRRPTRIGERLEEVDGGGYDHCYVLSDAPSLKEPRWFARLKEPESGRVMEVETTFPGVQLYTANYLKPKWEAPDGRPYGPHHGVCLETQAFPNAPNQPRFPSTLLLPGEEYRQLTRFRFSVATE